MKNKVNILVIATASLFIFGCTASDGLIVKNKSSNLLSNNNTSELSEQQTNITQINAFQVNTDVVSSETINRLAYKMKQAEFTVMALNDEHFIRKALAIQSNKNILNIEITDQYVQCVYANIERDKYNNELDGVAEYLTANYPEDIEFYIQQLEILTPIVHRIYSFPQPVEFNSQNISDSSALKILTIEHAQILLDAINNTRLTPLLATIGLPTRNKNGQIENITLMQINSLMHYVEDAAFNCQQ